MSRLLYFALFALGVVSAALLPSARAANVLHIHSTSGVPASPPPGTYTGNSYDFAGDQTFSDTDGWSFEVDYQAGTPISFLINRPDLSQLGYYGQYGSFFHPPTGTTKFAVGDYVGGGHDTAVFAIDGPQYESTKLQILDIAYDPATGALTSLAADFAESTPNFPGRVLYGQLRYNSDVSLGAGHPYLLFDKADYSASEADDGVPVTVLREGGTVGTVSVNYAVTGGTAAAGVDYTPVSGTLTWAAGDASPKVIYLPVLKNAIVEGERTITLALTGNNLGAVTQTTVTLATDPLPPSLLHFRYFGPDAQDVTQTTAQGFTFTGAISSPPSTYLSVDSTPGVGPFTEENLSLAGGNRLVVGNYTVGNTGEFEFNGPLALENVGGEDWQILQVNYGVDGTLLQLAMNFEVTDTGGQPLLRGEIRYHSTLPLRSTVEFTAATFAGNRSAGQIQIMASRQGDASEAISARYSTADYSAVGNVDYTAAKGKLTWAAGDTNPKTFTVPVLHDPASGNRVFFVDLKGDSLGDNTTATVTIVDDSLPSASSLPEPDGRLAANYSVLLANSSEVYVGVIRPLAAGGALIGGNFATVGGKTQPGILRLDAAGTPDFSFASPLNPAIAPEVDAIVVQPDGKTLVAGWFAVGTNTQRTGLLRLNANGTVDPGFRTDPAVSGGTVHGLALQPDGRLIVAGDFRAGNGLARLGANGALDGSFAPPTSAYLDSHSLVLLQPDGKVLTIDTYGVLKRLNADGSVDASYTAGGGPFFNTATGSVALQPDGKLVLAAGTSEGKLIRLNADGSVDTGFSLATDTLHQILEVASVALQPDGKLLVGIVPDLSGGTSSPALLRLNPDGSPDDSFTVSTTLPPAIGALALEADGGLLLSAGYESTSGKNVVHTVFAKLAGTVPASQEAVVSIAASIPQAGGADGQVGEFLLTIPSAQSADLIVSYQVKGTGINGTDYAYLKGTAKIKAGRISKTIKVVPQSGSGDVAAKTVKLVLEPGTGYTVGPTAKAKISLAAH